MLAQYRVEQFDGEVIPYRQYKENRSGVKHFQETESVRNPACGNRGSSPFSDWRRYSEPDLLPLGLYLTFTKHKIMQF